MISRKLNRLMMACAATLAFGLSACGDDATTGNQTAPEPRSNIVEVAQDAGVFGTLLAAVDAAGLTDTLRGDGPFTVFAPTDDAFAALPDGTVESLLLPENIDTLTSILTYHVIGGEVRASDAIAAGSAETLNGALVSIVESDGQVRVNDAVVLQADVLATNGVIHVIDSVLLP